MKLPRARHLWNLTPRQAIRLQRRLAAEVRSVPLPVRPRTVAGGDVAFTPDGNRVLAGWVVWDLDAQVVVDTAMASRPATFPYVPGLLSFREAPALIAAARKLTMEPDVFMFDGQGLAHPRRFGLACHVGLLIERPSLGCAKSRLCGTVQPIKPSRATRRRTGERGSSTYWDATPRPKPGALGPLDVRGASSPLVHEGQVIGRVVRTRAGVKPVYVSVGHKITLAEAVRLTLRCCTKYRLPEPTRLAHALVTRRRTDYSLQVSSRCEAT